jgi:maleylacetate reductase
VPGFTFDQLPQRVVFGVDAARTATAPEIERLGARRVLAIASTRDAERVATLLDPLGGRVVGTFTEVREHVPLPTAEAARDAAAAAGADLLLAIGGGSTIGAAKAVAMTARLPIVAVPTTYAGSEITPIWGLTENGRKTTGVDPAVLPRVVIYDPTLTATLPPDLAAASGFNALAHAVEAMWAPRRNPVSTAVAGEAVERLARGLGTGDPAELLCGAWLGSSAFAVAGSGLHHKLCHVLGGTFGLPHAGTHAVVLPHVLAFNAPGAPDVARRVARALGVDDAVTGLRALADAHGIPRGLRALGLPEDALAEAAALTEPAVPADNPVPVADGAMLRLVRAAWSGSDDVLPTETRRHEKDDSPS